VTKDSYYNSIYEKTLAVGKSKRTGAAEVRKLRRLLVYPAWSVVTREKIGGQACFPTAPS
jgi:N-dimethylarginine dimethylaminohydrolase